jgi:NADPH-dependent dioxygenase
MLSLELARYGVAARTVDRLAGPTVTSKAITVHARTAEIFTRIDPRLGQRFLDRAVHNKGYVLHFVDDAGKRSEVRPGLDFTHIDSPYPFILVHGQSDTERVLREYLRDEYGRGTEWGVECASVQLDGDAVLATLRHADGSEERVRCRYLVACDGANSRVRRALNLVQDESDYAGTKMQNMDVYLHGFPDADDWVHYCAGTSHFIMIVKLPGGYHRLLLSDRGEAADPNVAPRRAFANLVDQHFDGVELGDVLWHSRWESSVRLAHTYRAGNVFLAGDSAHVHSTTGGQGMNCCIQDAYNLGWKLGLVLAGAAPSELLDSYETERRPIAEQVIWAASSLHDIFMRHGKSIAERRARMDDTAFLDAVVGRCSGLSYTYRGCLPQVGGLEGPANGDRAPDVAFAGGQWLHASGAATSFALRAVYSDAAATPALRQRLDALATRYGATLDIATLRRSREFTARYGAEPVDQLVLLRPDGYLGYRCAASDFDGLERYLAGVLLPRGGVA